MRVLKCVFFLNIWDQKKGTRYLYEMVPEPEPTDRRDLGQVGKQKLAHPLSAHSL